MTIRIAPGLSPEKIAFLLFSVFFIVVMLIVAISVPSPTESQWRVFNLVLSLVAASMAAVLPGVFQFQLTPWLKTSGAVAVFAFVYLIKPAGLVSSDPSKPLGPPPPIEMARTEALRWLAVNDLGNHQSAHNSMRPKFRETYKYDDFVELARKGRDSFGKALERQEIGQNATEAPPNERGYFRVYNYMTKFEGVSEPIEESVLVFGAESSSAWQPAGYSLNLQRGFALRVRPNSSPAASSP